MGESTSQEDLHLQFQNLRSELPQTMDIYTHSFGHNAKIFSILSKIYVGLQAGFDGESTGILSQGVQWTSRDPCKHSRGVE
jgi:hypothetical protein